ncbi:MAG: hypothetical protein WC254_06900, partial [Candidatus Woesearchaeota archaeon]
SEIRSAPTDVARRAAAPGHMPRIHNTQQILGNLRYRMDTILQHAQYPNVPDTYRSAFERSFATLLNAEAAFTSNIYIPTIRWL